MMRFRNLHLRRVTYFLVCVLLLIYSLHFYFQNDQNNKNLEFPVLNYSQINQKAIVPVVTGSYAQPERMKAVKEIFQHAWKGYKDRAWGANEINVVSGTPHNNPIFGNLNMGATIVDALDTIYIMGLHEELPDARKWIESNLKFDIPIEISVFEYNIRFLGGLLSIYSLTKDELYLNKAKEFADSVLSAFNTPSGIPYSLFNLKSKAGRSHSWGISQCAILSEFGTLHMEFAYLSELTNTSIYLEKASLFFDFYCFQVQKIRKFLVNNKDRYMGLYYIHYSYITGSSCGNTISFGAMGDSFYEYLLKEYKRTGGKDTEALKIYEETIDGAIKAGLFKTSFLKNLYLTSFGTVAETFMEHLTCFMGGLLAYGAKNISDHEFTLGANLTQTCRLSYDKTVWKLGPDKFHFKSESIDAIGMNNDVMYIQRPEVVESYFYLWRLTKDQKYRDWAWDVVKALEKTKTNFGYGGVSNVYDKDSKLDPIQQSFFLAETLKYLYLIFCDDDVISLDKWVFNTEAHPLPIHGSNWSKSK